jgi:hypothetical protein
MSVLGRRFCSKAAKGNTITSWWKYWTSEVTLAHKYSIKWWQQYAIIFTIFGITGSSSLFVSRPLLKNVLGEEGTLRDGGIHSFTFVDKLGPWRYRISYFAIVPPSYSALLYLNGTLFGYQAYFSKVLGRMKPFLLMSAVSLAVVAADKSLRPNKTES